MNITSFVQTLGCLVISFGIFHFSFVAYVYLKLKKFEKLYEDALCNYGIAKSISTYCGGIDKFDLLEVQKSIAAALDGFEKIDHFTNGELDHCYTKLLSISYNCKQLKTK